MFEKIPPPAFIEQMFVFTKNVSYILHSVKNICHLLIEQKVFHILSTLNKAITKVFHISSTFY